MSHSPTTRKQTDFAKLIYSGYDVEVIDNNPQKFWVNFKAPEDTPYENFYYRVRVELPEQYPYGSPSIGFEGNSMYHPNVDERSGSVCLDVINQTWTPMYSLVNIFDVFLPQLLTYPNPSDPLNAEAAAMYSTDMPRFKALVKTCYERSRLAKERRSASAGSSEAGSPDWEASSTDGAPGGKVRGSSVSTTESSDMRDSFRKDLDDVEVGSTIEMVEYDSDLDDEFA